jgi:ABC-type lipoprotein export system ATPase subunit
MSLIELENVTKVYRTGEASVKALKGISLQLEKQTFVSFIGPSGSRKSTLLNLIGVLDRPTRGTIRVNGTEQIGSQRAFSKHFERVQRYGSFVNVSLDQRHIPSHDCYQLFGHISRSLTDLYDH